MSAADAVPLSDPVQFYRVRCEELEATNAALIAALRDTTDALNILQPGAWALTQASALLANLTGEPK